MAQQTIILALDPARLCGYAIGDGTRRVSGVWDLSKGTESHPGGQLLRLAELLERAIMDNHVTVVATELASFGSVNRNTASAHNEKLGVIRLVCCQHEVRVVGYHPTSIKKFITGSGRADKKQMIRGARTMLGLTTESDDKADAAAILALAQYELTRPYVGHQAKQKRAKSGKPKGPVLFR
jgi:crossover junction endodeoxyribonuclease RuvC